MIKIKDKDFEPFIDQETLAKKVEEMGKQISLEFKDESPILLGVLNGSFMFLSDLAKQIRIPVEISFVKIASYTGTVSSGKINGILGLEVDMTDRTILIVEDIVDTGLSMNHLIDMVALHQPKKIAVATLLLKPEALKFDVKIDYVGFEIPNKFVVGYGLDYDGYGRNLSQIYQLKI
jgi:hypoxanthine phosphoribosyltransferase